MAFTPLTGRNTYSDLIDYINAVYSETDGLGTAANFDIQAAVDDTIADRVLRTGAFGLGGDALLSTGSANNFIIGSFTNTAGTEANCVSRQLPAIENSVGTENRIYSVITYGRGGEVVQFATELLSEGNPQFKRVFSAGSWSEWVPVGSGSGSAKYGIFYEGDQVLTSNYTLPPGKNAMSAGPVTLADGVEVIVDPGSSWTIV